MIPYYSLASGFLTGKYRSEADLAQERRAAASVKKYLDERGLRILAALDEVAARHRVDAGPGGDRLAAWRRPSVTAPIASATSVEQLDELIEAARRSSSTPASIAGSTGRARCNRRPGKGRGPSRRETGRRRDELRLSPE